MIEVVATGHLTEDKWGLLSLAIGYFARGG